jgi:dTDP-4-amino-4,6-dideoxygalactose transaminase
MKTKLAIHGGRPVQKSGKIKSAIGKEELLAAKNVVKGGVLSSFRGGNEVRSFESSFAEYVGASNGLATTSGTTALHTCVAALGLTPNDEVLVPALTFVSTASVVVQESAKVVFVDVGDDYCMDPGDLERKITPRSKAVIPVHLYGRPAPMDEIRKIAKKFNLVVIEDACQSHGATYKDSKTGSLGDAGCFSFFQTKNMTCGEGGMITTSSADYYDKLCQRREHGSPRSSTTWYNYEVLGYNYNMTEVQGAIGKVQLAKLDTMNNARIANAKLYDESLGGLGLTLPPAYLHGKNVYHNYPVLLPEAFRSHRDFFVSAMRAEGIPIDVAYPCALYDTTLFKNLGIKGKCPKTEDVTSRLFTLFTDSAINELTVHNTRKAIEKIFLYLQSGV